MDRWPRTSGWAWSASHFSQPGATRRFSADAQIAGESESRATWSAVDALGDDNGTVRDRYPTRRNKRAPFTLGLGRTRFCSPWRYPTQIDSLARRAGPSTYHRRWLAQRSWYAEVRTWTVCPCLPAGAQLASSTAHTRHDVESTPVDGLRSVARQALCEECRQRYACTAKFKQRW